MEHSLFDKFLLTMGKPLAKRFVAGNEMGDALTVASQLNAGGAAAIINFLGEEVKTVGAANLNRKIYEVLIKEISARKLNARIAVKPSQLGVNCLEDFQYAQNLKRLFGVAIKNGVSIEIDIEHGEDAEQVILTTTATKLLFGDTVDLRQALAVNIPRHDDFIALLDGLCVKIRLCKGAYPPNLSQKELRQRYGNAAVFLLNRGAFPAFATHDTWLIKRICELGFQEFELQFLLGFHKNLWEEPIALKRRVAVYVPFGENWLPYAKRRWQYLLAKVPRVLLG